jgi:hydroxymethylglutaryl-CoA reductase (NADPH)
MWIMKAVKNGSSSTGGLRNWASNAWTDFLDLLKVRSYSTRIGNPD